MFEIVDVLFSKGAVKRKTKTKKTQNCVKKLVITGSGSRDYTIYKLWLNIIKYHKIDYKFQSHYNLNSPLESSKTIWYAFPTFAWRSVACMALPLALNASLAATLVTVEPPKQANNGN